MTANLFVEQPTNPSGTNVGARTLARWARRHMRQVLVESSNLVLTKPVHLHDKDQ